MPSIGHLAVGLATARHQHRPPRLPTAAWVAILTAASFAPDADVVAFAFGIPYHAPWGHRGAAHSPAFAAACGAGLGLLAAAVWGAAGARLGLVVALVMATHGILDAFTDGGLGVALLWPLSDERFFAPVRPIPVAPIGAGMWSVRGLRVVLYELLIFAPLFAYSFWPRRADRP